MLVLTRIINERVVFEDEDGNRIGHITVCAVSGDKVSLGFTFPRSVHIVRAELIERSEKPDRT